MKNEFNIVLSTNERYMPGATVALVSLAVNAKPETQLHFHVFTENVKHISWKLLVESITRVHPKSVIENHVCGEDILSGLPAYSGSRMAWVRCFYPRLLPSVDWALYLDCDVLYLAAPEEHFAYKDDAVYACVTRDMSPISSSGDAKWARDKCGVELKCEDYFNSGVMLFNFKKFREDNMSERIAEFIRQHPDGYYADQTAMNVIFNGRGLKYLPSRYNYLQIYLDDTALLQRPVIHYVNGIPWLRKVSTVANGRYRLWHAFADKYIWRKDGTSEKRLFPVLHRIVVRIEFFLLRSHTFEPLFRSALKLIGKGKCYASWKWSQVGNDIKEIIV